MAGIAAAAASPKTPAHLKPHLEAMTHEDWKVLSEDDPDYKVVGEEPKGQKFKKGDAVSLPGGGSGTIQWIGARHDGKDYARVKAENGSKIESVRVDRLKPMEAEHGSDIVFARHGATKLDQEGSNETVAGWSDEPLDDRGVKSANEIADKLKDHGLTHIVSSDLHRAKQTADIVAKKLGIEVTTDKRLRPQHVPETEGLKIGQAKPIWNHYESHPDEKPKGGESWREFTKRQDEALKEVEASAKAGQKPMVMTHSRNLEAELGQKPEPGGIVIAKRGTTKQPAKRTPSWAHSRGEK